MATQSPTKSSKSSSPKGKLPNARVDAARAKFLEDYIRKENAARGRHLQHLVATDPNLAASLRQDEAGPVVAPAAEPPELFQTIKSQSLARPDKGSSLDISRALANSVNPGFYLQDPSQPQRKDDFALDEAELEYMRAQGALGSTQHHRKKNDLSKYVESAARQRLVEKAAQKKPPAAAAGS